MKNWLKIAGIGVICSTLLFVACRKDPSDNNNNNNGFDRGTMLTNYADGYIIPAYNNMVQSLADLKTKTGAFVATPDLTTLTAVKTAWLDAYRLWQKVDMLEFGPDQSVALRMYMNIYPVTTSKINSNISSGTYDLEQFGNTDAQGFPALDYLLNGLASNNNDILNYYTTDGQATNRKQYLQAIANKMLQKVTAVRDAWTSNYRSTFINATGTDVNGSLSLMTNAFVLYYERYLRAGKIGLPVGAMTGVAAPNLTEAFYSPTLSKDLALSALSAINDFYEGINFNGIANGNGFKEYLAAVATKDENGQLISDLIATELAQAKTSLEGLSSPIREAVNSDRNTVLNIYTELQQVVPLFKVDMVSAFGISITYVDNDGD